MITPPIDATCYYTARFQSEQTIQMLLDEILEVHASDFDMALVVSIDLLSDIDATNSMCTGVEKIEQRLTDTASKKLTFNPLYLPISTAKLFDTIEMDINGKVLSVGDFTDPFVTCNMQLFDKEDILTVLGKVSYNEFEVHHPIDPSQPQAVQYLS
jgi:hypothetical protein